MQYPNILPQVSSKMFIKPNLLVILSNIELVTPLTKRAANCSLDEMDGVYICLFSIKYWITFTYFFSYKKQRQRDGSHTCFPKLLSWFGQWYGWLRDATIYDGVVALWSWEGDFNGFNGFVRCCCLGKLWAWIFNWVRMPTRLLNLWKVFLE